MKELWTGRVELLTPPTEFGDTKAFTNIVTWASDAQQFRDRVASVLEEYGWSLIDVEECGPVSRFNSLGEEVSEVVESAKVNPNACIYTTFHYYPSKPS
jgi:nicotinamide riboside kinase